MSIEGGYLITSPMVRIKFWDAFLLTFMVFRLACFIFLLVTGDRPLYLFGIFSAFSLWEKIKDQLAQAVHRIHDWSCLGSENQSLKCLPISARSSCGLLVFRDHLLSLVLDFYQGLKNVIFFSFRSVSLLKYIYFVSVFGFGSQKNNVPFRYVSW
jgi:hypothetical protein